MKSTDTSLGRRKFFKSAATLTLGAGLSSLPSFATAAPFLDKSGTLVIGPIEGYTPYIGTLVSMLNYNRQTIINSVKNLTIAELDYLHDKKANTIGALVMHLGATEKFYQANTFEGRQDLTDEEKKIWGSAGELGDVGRKNIKGKPASYYIDLITEVRKKTLETLKTKDDAWLLAVDPEWSKEEPLNCFWKWFHVCEHESNHRGQIAFLKGRLPGAKESKE